jgi:hypothetical protein
MVFILEILADFIVRLMTPGVAPKEATERPKIAVFRDWLLNATREGPDTLARPGIGKRAEIS